MNAPSLVSQLQLQVQQLQSQLAQLDGLQREMDKLVEDELKNDVTVDILSELERIVSIMETMEGTETKQDKAVLRDDASFVDGSRSRLELLRSQLVLKRSREVEQLAVIASHVANQSVVSLASSWEEYRATVSSRENLEKKIQADEKQVVAAEEKLLLRQETALKDHENRLRDINAFHCVCKFLRSLSMQNPKIEEITFLLQVDDQNLTRTERRLLQRQQKKQINRK